MRSLIGSLLLFASLFPLLSPPLSAQWRITSSTDEMTGKKSVYALSPRVQSTRPMVSPYTGVTGQIGFGCSGQDEWVYVHFSEAPNLVGTETHDGYDIVRTRLRWDDSVVRGQFRQDWGERFLHFRPYDTAIEKIMAAGVLLVELPWYGSGDVYFRFSLAGSSDAISRARGQCRNRP